MFRFIATVAIVIGSGIFGTTMAAAQAKKATLALNVYPYGIHVGFYAALERGYYKENGIDLNLTRGFGSSDTVKRVGVGDIQLGFAESSVMVVGHSGGLDVKAVAMILDKSPWVVYSNAKANIKSLKDLEGKSVGISGVAQEDKVYQLVANKFGGDAKKVDWKTVDVSAQIPSLITGRVDAIITFATFGPQYLKAAKDVGMAINQLLFRDYGLDIYGIALLTSKKIIDGDPQLMRGLIGATIKGHDWARQNPKEAVEIFIKHNPTSDREIVRAQWDVLVDGMTTDAARTLGIGAMEDGKWQRTVDFAKEIVGAKPPALSSIYTNEFLPGIKMAR